MSLPSAVVDRVRERLVADGRPPSAADVARALRDDGVLLGPDVLLAEAERLHGEMSGAGPLSRLLRDPLVTDVLVTGPDQVWVDRGRGVEPVDVRFADDDAVRRLAQRLAAACGRRLALRGCATARRHAGPRGARPGRRVRHLPVVASSASARVRP